jgi:HAD superfamily hydrolase (TIGR01459 family)
MTNRLPQELGDLSQIAPRYAHFLIDVWGVVHDGRAVFAEARTCLEELRGQGKTVVLFTNAPRPAQSVARQLVDLGLQESAWDGIFSSGEALLTQLQVWYAQKKRYLFFLGTQNHQFWRDLAFEEVDRVSHADFLLALAPRPGLRFPDDYGLLLQTALERNVPMLCGNPDVYVVSGGQKVLCAGALGHMYEKMGGTVLWCGKPQRGFYEMCLKKFGLESRHTLAVGDSLLTDIQGPNTTIKPSKTLLIFTQHSQKHPERPRYRTSHAHQVDKNVSIC